MRRLYFLLPVVLCLTASLWGQVPNGNSPPIDPQLQARIDEMNSASIRYRDTARAQAQALAVQAYDLSKNAGYARGEITSAFILAGFEQEDRNNRAAARYAEGGLEVARNTGDRDAELRGLQLLVDIYRQANRKNKLADTELALENLEKSIQLDETAVELTDLRQEKAGVELELTEAEGELSNLEQARERISRKLALTQEEKLRQEADLALLERQMLALRYELVVADNEKMKQELELSLRENEIYAIKTRLQQQRFWQTVLLGGLGASIIIILLIVRNYRLKRRQAEQTAALQRQLLIQEKMATLGQMTAGIAHEIKNPLNFVNNFAEGSRELAGELEESLVNEKGLLQADSFRLMEELVGDLKQNAHDILEHGQRADRIVNSMMAHARGDKGQMEMVDINRLLEDNLILSYHGYRALHANFNLTIEENLAPNLPMIMGVPQDLSRVFLNIFNNACYALHHQEGATEEPKLMVSTRLNGKRVEIRIRDNGPGIPPDVRSRIFEPFFTTKPTGQGNTGLGLSMAYDTIVQLHEGAMEVESEEGKFTEFIIRLQQ